MTPIKIRIFYPADPLGIVPGGVDTFLRGLIKYAPDDLRFGLVGMTTDPGARPLGRWTPCQLGSREFEIFPACAVQDAGGRGRIPLVARYLRGVARHRRALRKGFDVFDFHRIEPILMWASDQRPKNAFFHQDPDFVRQGASDAVWRHWPSGYEAIERKAARSLRSAWCVRQSGVETLRERYPSLAVHTHFVPTWVDADVFHPIAQAPRAQLRARLAERHGIDPGDTWLISVGRLDTQKDPLSMLRAVVQLAAQGRRVQWLVVGDGVLRPDMQQEALRAGLGDRVHFLGLQPPAVIADWLRASDLFGLSSAYEGMPMALLEALGSGLPVVATDVGEVWRVVQDGVNGRLVPAQDAQALCRGLSDALDHLPQWSGAPALAAIAAYQPAAVLGPVFENYRHIGEPLRRLRLHGAAPRDSAELTLETGRNLVVNVPLDAMPTAAVLDRILGWARQGESRSVCFVNAHSAVQTSRDERHRLVLDSSDLNVPDGAPIAWTLRVKGRNGQPRVDGPSTMLRLIEQAERQGLKVGIFGSTPEVIQALCRVLRQRFPELELSYAGSPPFRDLTRQEERLVQDQIHAAGVQLLFVGLGCPKQEYWIASQRGHIQCVMLGVGGALEMHAGFVSRAPHWMRERGLEWLHRLASQPGRLWRRYAFTNLLFLKLSAAEALQMKVHLSPVSKSRGDQQLPYRTTEI